MNAATARVSVAEHRVVVDRAGRGDGDSISSCSALRGGDERQLALERAAYQHAGNQQAVDLVGALEDAVDARVAVVALGRVVADEAVAAVNLHVLVEHEVERLAARHLGDRRLDRRTPRTPCAIERAVVRRDARAPRR